MKANIQVLLIIALSITMLHCNTQKSESFTSKVVYKSDDLIITQISENALVHTSFLQTNDFGDVPCNGLIVGNNKEVVVFDTPTNDKNSKELIQWIKDSLHHKINAVIPTHFHADCLGGLKAFDEANIPSYAYFKTVELAKENGRFLPRTSFRDSLILKVGNKEIAVKFFGEGHTTDNIVGYFPDENIMFGGCLIKGLNAEKGNLEDANVSAWSTTVEKVKTEYPDVKIVVPGHGNYGGKELLDYTINLFKTE